MIPPRRPVGNIRAVAAGAFALSCGATAAVLRPVWLDELFSLRLAKLSFPEILGALERDSGPPGHYFLLHALFGLLRWPDGGRLAVLAVRLPSVLAGTAVLLLVLRH